MNGSRTRQLRKETGKSKPGRVRGQLHKAVAVGRQDRTSSNEFSTAPTSGAQITKRMVEERAKRERNRQLLADADVISLIAAESQEGETAPDRGPLQQTPEELERARKDAKNAQVRTARAAKKAAQAT